MKKIILIAFMAAASATMASAAVTSVDYRIDYNPATCQYDVKLVVLAGSATIVTDRFVGTAKLTLVLPTGTVFDPSNNQTAGEPKNTAGTAGVKWNNSNYIVAPASAPTNDFVDFNAPTSGTRYSSISGPTTITLFSLSIPSSTCGAGIRLFVNGSDPNSSAAGFGGADLSNSFKIGSTATERYSGNQAGNTTPPSPTITTLTPACAGVSPATVQFTTDAAPGSACATPLTYAFTATPVVNGSITPTTSTSATPTFSATTSAGLTGTYAVTVTDGNGCTTSFNRGFIGPTCLVVPPTSLPVTLKSFGAEMTHINGNCAVRADWTIAATKNVAYYTLQRSTDASRWESVDQQNATGSIEYSFTDMSPYSGNSLYRLATTDANGSVAYSSTARVNVDCGIKAGVITVFPNPTTNNVTVSGLTDKAAYRAIRILNTLGQVMAEETVSDGATTHTMTIGSLPPAAYMLQVIENSGIVKSVTLIKQ